MVVLVLLLSAGAFLAYENTLPTTLTTNVKSGQKDVPTDGAFILNYSRSISIDAIRAAFTALNGMGFTHLRVLMLPTDFNTDWIGKGYPVEKATLQ